MVSSPALQQQLDQKVEEIKQAVSGISEEKASKRPGEGEWCVKEVLSHLTGEDHAPAAQEFYERCLKEDKPELDITPGQSAYSPEREKAPVKELLSRVETRYGELGKFLAGLNEEQLNRKARVPFLKETPIGEYPTLGMLGMGLINFHLNDHLNQLRNLSQQ